MKLQSLLLYDLICKSVCVIQFPLGICTRHFSHRTSVEKRQQLTPQNHLDCTEREGEVHTLGLQGHRLLGPMA